MYSVKPKVEFIFPCYRILKKGLGEFDSIIECNELAVRKFIKEAQDSDSVNKYVEHESKKYSVRVDIVDINQMSVRTAQLYILSVYQQAEVFLRTFQREHPGSSLWKARKDGESRLHWILDCLNNNSFITNCNEIGRHRFELFEYYRLVRNHFIHDPVNLRDVDAKFNELREFKDQILAEYKLAAPNSYREQSFDDFMLFSRVVKHIAIELCRIGKPQDQEILITRCSRF
jgi:hypothetical protein